MTPRQIELVQSSFRKVLPIDELAAELFYRHLFELDPSLRPLFKGDMKQQGRKLMAMLAAAVNGLTSLDSLLPAVEALGARHAGYGVKNADYDTVGEALIFTLKLGLDDSFTPDVEAAWIVAYTTLAGVMKHAAAGVPARVS